MPSGYILLPEGFQAGWICEIVYTGRDPLVMNLGPPQSAIL